MNLFRGNVWCGRSVYFGNMKILSCIHTEPYQPRKFHQFIERDDSRRSYVMKANEALFNPQYIYI